MRRNERFELRLPQELAERLKAVAQERDTSVASVVRMALENEMRHGEPAIAKTERIVSASIDRLARDLDPADGPAGSLRVNRQPGSTLLDVRTRARS